MNGDLGLGMAIPEEATAELGPLPHLVPTITREQRDAEVRVSCKPAGHCTVGTFDSVKHACSDVGLELQTVQASRPNTHSCRHEQPSLAAVLA